jgi:dTDP-4-amino-4,6-dideoxygalactose transaminase
MYRGKPAGTWGDIGIFSLNRHKNLQCGEGGIAVTNDDELALRMQLIRNHGENMADKPGYAPKSLVNMLGFNFRMTEVEAAIAYEQLKKMDALNRHRIESAEFLNQELAGLPGLTLPATRPGATHVYYMYITLYDETKTGITRKRLIDAIRAEGITIWGGYLKPLYLEPLYQKKIAIGDKGFPFVGPHYSGTIDYSKGICPVAEELYEKKTIVNPYLYPPLSMSDMRDIVEGIKKVYKNREQLL